MWGGVHPRDADRRVRDPSHPRGSEPIGPRDVFTQGLALPRGPERERVHARDRDYQLRGSEVRTLATIGAFRVVPADDLRDDHGRAGDVRHGDLERLRNAGLIRTVAPFARDERTVLVTLTERGRDVLESHRTRAEGTSQSFYAGSVKSRELSHDAQLYRAY